MSPEQLRKLRHAASYWAIENNRVVGFVVIYQGIVCGWAVSPQQLVGGGWLAGAVAIPVDPSQKPRVAVGGDLIDGAARWDELA